MNYPIAEIFYSIQGEGANAGRAALFVRLAGCCVGRKVIHGEGANFHGMKPFPIQCVTASGQAFPCDTDFRIRESLTERAIIDRFLLFSFPCKLVFITGGEPLMHHLFPLLDLLRADSYEVWVETSGVVPIPEGITDLCKIVLSPKAGCLPEAYKVADHVKYLVDTGTEELPAIPHKKVYIQPIEAIGDPERSKRNMERAVGLVLEQPRSRRLSLQTHKVLGVR